MCLSMIIFGGRITREPHQPQEFMDQDVWKLFSLKLSELIPLAWFTLGPSQISLSVT